MRGSDSAAKVSIDQKTGPSAALTHSLKLEVTAASQEAPAGVENGGFWGIPVRPNSTYTGSFWAKSDQPGLAVSVSLENDLTGVAAATATVTGLTGEWKQYNYTLTTDAVAPSSNNHLLLTVTKPSTVWFELVSLFPPTYKNRPEGNRVDLMDKLAAMQPKFLRLPGGNYLEGDHIAQPLELPLLRRHGPARVSRVVRRPEDGTRSGRLCWLLPQARAR
jgi:alpha-N-arabinofuranosidase